MRDEIIKQQMLAFLFNFKQNKRKNTELYNEKINRLEEKRKNSFYTTFEDHFYQITKIRHERMKEVDVMLGQLLNEMD